MKDALNFMALNAKLGDGGIYKSGVNCYLYFSSTSLDLLSYKREMCKKAGLKPSDFEFGTSGYGGKKKVYNFRTRNSEKITPFKYMDTKDAIDLIDKESLILWYLDDGSLHKRKKFVHLYCNTLTEDEVQYLIDKIYQLYPYKKCALRWDRKKDGRKYPYIYMSAVTARYFLKDVAEFIDNNDIPSMSYKAAI